MKKTIKSELVSLAHKILQLRDGADYSKMAEQARLLQEKLTILSFAEKLEKEGMPTIGLKEIEEEIMGGPLSRKSENLEPLTSEDPEVIVEKKVETNAEKVEIPTPPKQTKSPEEIRAENQARFAEARSKEDFYRPDGTQFNDEEPLHEPVIEKIKDMWPEMTPEAADIDKVIDSIIPNQPSIGKNDSFEIGNEYGRTPIFEPKETVVEEIEEKPKNLNDRLKTGLKIGLNDKLSFIKHLFSGSASDYNRVLSQLETFNSTEEAKNFINTMVKPDYNNWEGKEVQEERFMMIVEGKYN